MQQVTRQYREFVPIEQLPDKYLGGYKSLHERYYNDTRFASSLAHHLGSSFTCELDSENETVSHPLTMAYPHFCEHIDVRCVRVALALPVQSRCTWVTLVHGTWVIPVLMYMGDPCT